MYKVMEIEDLVVWMVKLLLAVGVTVSVRLICFRSGT